MFPPPPFVPTCLSVQDSKAYKRFRCTAKLSQVDTAAMAIANFDNNRSDARNMGPSAALRNLKLTTRTREEKRRWLTLARSTVLLGSCPKTHKSFMSGQRAWASFARHTLDLRGRELPPPIDGLIAWAELFRCHDTYSNYLGHVRLACQLLGVSDNVFVRHENLLRRAKASIRKKPSSFTARPKMFIKQVMIQRILNLPYPADPHSETACSERFLRMLFLAAYIFLLRLPSEALPMTSGGVGFVTWFRPTCRHLILVYAQVPQRVEVSADIRRRRAGLGAFIPKEQTKGQYNAQELLVRYLHGHLSGPCALAFLRQPRRWCSALRRLHSGVRAQGVEDLVVSTQGTQCRALSHP